MRFLAVGGAAVGLDMDVGHDLAQGVAQPALDVAGDVVGALATQTLSRRKGANMYFEALVLGYDLPGSGFVRCIKDE